jgi:Putative transposase
MAPRLRVTQLTSSFGARLRFNAAACNPTRAGTAPGRDRAQQTRTHGRALSECDGIGYGTMPYAGQRRDRSRERSRSHDASRGGGEIDRLARFAVSPALEPIGNVVGQRTLLIVTAVMGAFGGPKQVLRYLARYTHRVAISNRRLIAADETGVTFKYKDYRGPPCDTGLTRADDVIE